MPHDKNNNEIRPGDIVMVPCEVGAVYSTENGEYCNCELITLSPMPPYTEGSHITLNTQQVVLLASVKPDEVD